MVRWHLQAESTSRAHPNACRDIYAQRNQNLITQLKKFQYRISCLPPEEYETTFSHAQSSFSHATFRQKTYKIDKSELTYMHRHALNTVDPLECFYDESSRISVANTDSPGIPPSWSRDSRLDLEKASRFTSGGHEVRYNLSVPPSLTLRRLENKQMEWQKLKGSWSRVWSAIEKKNWPFVRHIHSGGVIFWLFSDHQGFRQQNLPFSHASREVTSPASVG